MGRCCDLLLFEDVSGSHLCVEPTVEVFQQKGLPSFTEFHGHTTSMANGWPAMFRAVANSKARATNAGG